MATENSAKATEGGQFSGTTRTFLGLVIWAFCIYLVGYVVGRQLGDIPVLIDVLLVLGATVGGLVIADQVIKLVERQSGGLSANETVFFVTVGAGLVVAALQWMLF